MKKSIITIILIFLVSIMSVFSDPRGEEIAKKNYNLPEAADSYSISTMVLINSRGDKKVRKLKMYSKKAKDGTNSFIEFVEPADVKGTRFLTIGHKKGDDEQRLYLPALGKVRRISSSKKGGSFMGSDLNFFDMEDHDFTDFQYKYIKDETYNGMSCHIIEMYPEDENAPYSKQVAWINKSDFFAYKVECYDKKSGNPLMKTIVMMDVKSIGGVLMPGKLVVDHHLKNHKTLLSMSDRKVNIGLKDTIFSVQNLTK